MLSNFVRGKSFVVIVLIALFAGLGFFGADYSFRNAGTGSENCFIKVYGRCYRLQEAQRMAEFHRLANELFLIDFARSLFGEDRIDQDPTDFVMGLIILRREAKRLGVEPTLEEVREAVPNLPRFRLQTNLDAEMIKNGLLGPRGLSEGDFFQLVKDYLSWQRIQDLLEAGLRVPESEVDKLYLRNYQQFTASLVQFDRAKFEEQVEVTEEDIKQYFEANKDSLLSDEKRTFQIVTFTPPAQPEGMTEEEKAKQKPRFANRVNEIYAELAEKPAEFDSLAQAAQKAAASEEAKKTIGGIEIKTLEPFSQFSPPEDLKEDARLLTGLFSQSLTLARPVTIPIEQEDGGYIVYKLIEVAPPAPMSLEDAREQINTVLKNQKSDQRVNEAATEARGKIAEALAAGKSIDEAAKSAGVELKPIDPFSKNEPPKGLKNPDDIVAAALITKPQSVSPLMPQPDGAGYQMLVVDKIELVESDDEASRKRTLENVARGEFRRSLFQAWFDEVKRESGAERAKPIETEGSAPAPSAP